ncbi:MULTISPECIES: imidazole glycerol phosphate synthase subunit HisH [Gammaproteobacteria]|uniref:imidazole glycerol phosphate synthase subunit HisH n=1 Tax=Gammaproteobacteria TaxID=1236 RepID=UPI000DD0D9C3|nr:MULTISPECIES: imidazole glycerol phosphate synthase subunit HisH [Gammaproteobacteria]RTE87618.1 imidazole glycerol phosphate synthase subunit HisH [Aliidiomarina sp. B3213]TCZ92597.1 imidazole glycerol phosphate synthase subunit HisH [Lysobacter sp. N42]
MRLAIVNTRCANLASVKYAFERLGETPVVTANSEQLKNAERVVLPGVGTASEAMNALQELELIGTLKGLTQPVLGICLGMQILTELSYETKRKDSRTTIPCLNVIPAEVQKLANLDKLPLPHMGWNKTEVTSHPLFNGLQDPYFYYVHSFAVPETGNTIASCEYGQKFSAAIAKNNFMGVQFHPERSGPAGSVVLKNFMEFPC